MLTYAQLDMLLFLQWLKEEFLVFLDTWEQSVQARPGFSASEKQKMLLSPQNGMISYCTLYV